MYTYQCNTLRVIDGNTVDAIIDLAAISNDPAGELDPLMPWSINHLVHVAI